MSKPASAHTRKPTAEEVAREALGAAQTAAAAEDLANLKAGGASANGAVTVDRDEIQIDPQLLAQAVQNKNARLIAMMVHENAMFEVALEQERRARQDAEAKYEALQASLSD